VHVWGDSQGVRNHLGGVSNEVSDSCEVGFWVLLGTITGKMTQHTFEESLVPRATSKVSELNLFTLLREIDAELRAAAAREAAGSQKTLPKLLV